MKNSYYNSASSHLYCYFGDTHDLFVDETLLPMSLPEALHRDLKRCGYERVIFFSYDQGAYFLDLESKELMHGRKAAPPVPVLSGATRGRLLGASAAPTQPAGGPSQDLSFTVDPPEMIRWAGEFMCGGSIKTAVIFPDGLNMMENMHAHADNGAMLNNLFNKVLNITDPVNRNVMIFLFNRKENAVLHFFENAKWGYIWESITKHAVFHHIPAASPAEIRLLLHHLRLTGIQGQTLRIDCSQIQEICQMIAGRFLYNINTEYNGRPHSTTGELTARQLKDLTRYLLDHFIIPGIELNLETCRTMCAQKAQEPALERLDQLIGMQTLKDTLKAYIRTYASDGQAPAHTLRLEPPAPAAKKKVPNLHFVLTGNKGTGKTTAARITGEVLREHGLLPSGHLIETSPTKLIGEYRGHSEANMRAVLERAKGGILFIDEAYGFATHERDGDSYREGMVNELVDHMTACHDAYCVILAGYPDRMAYMFENVNTGLKERFQNRIHIADYSPDELAQIFHLKASAHKRPVSPKMDAVLVPFLDNWYADNPDDWANGRMVENLINDMVLRFEGTLMPEMVPPELQKYMSRRDQIAVREQLDAMIGLGTVKQTIEDFEINLRYELDEPRNFHFVFAGNPGTGKTTVAKIFGQLLKGAGILKSASVNEVKAEELLKAPDALAQAISRSRNRVLFIDEAYQLLEFPTIFAQLADKIQTNDVDFPFCVICAGYDAEMERFMNYNIGVSRRFDVIHFDDYTPDELLLILKQHLSGAEPPFTVTEEFLQDTLAHFLAHQQIIAGKYNAGYIGKYMKAVRTLLGRKFAAQYGKDMPPREAYILDGSVVPDHFCG